MQEESAHMLHLKVRTFMALQENISKVAGFLQYAAT